MSTEPIESENTDVVLQSVRFVGPATAAALGRAGYDAMAITEKRVSYRRLVEVGVNPGVAAKLRREHSLSWSFRSGGNLNRRSAQVRGLGAAEAEWVAASTGDWETTREPSTNKSTDDAHIDASTDTDEPTPWPTHGQAVDANAVTDDSRDATGDRAVWGVQSTLRPVDELEDLDSAAVDQLADAGIISVRSLAIINVEQVADVLGLSKTVVDEWSRAAQAAAETR